MLPFNSVELSVWLTVMQNGTVRVLQTCTWLAGICLLVAVGILHFFLALKIYICLTLQRIKNPELT